MGPKGNGDMQTDCLDYQIPVTQLKGPKENGDMQAAKRDQMRHLPVISIYGYGR